MSAQIWMTARLPFEMHTRICREAAASGVSKSEVIRSYLERGMNGGGLNNNSIEELLRGIEERIQSVLQATSQVSNAEGGSIPLPAVEKILFSCLFSEALLQQLSAKAHQHDPNFIGLISEAREQAKGGVQYFMSTLE